MALVANIMTEMRPLGRTGFLASRLGIGDLADRNVPKEQCVATARRALDAGLNLIDTAPGYEDGYSEEIVGTVLRESGLRERVFLIDKIDHFDKPIDEQVEGSLRRLGLDHVDAFVFHGVSTMEDWETIRRNLAGPLEKLRGMKTRFLGISSHHPDVLREAIQSGWCDVVMFSIGPYVDERYLADILPLTKKHQVGTVTFKAFGAGKLLGDTQGYSRPLAQRPRGKISSGGEESSAAVLPRMTVEECLHYTLSCGSDVALLGMSFPNEQDAAFAAARSYRGPLSPEKMAAIRRRAIEAVRGKGPCWWNPNPHAHA